MSILLNGRKISRMGPVITSKSNARVKLLRAAAKGQRKAAEGLVALEGPQLLQEALRSGITPRILFLREGYTLPPHLSSQATLSSQGEICVLSSDVFESAVAVESSQGVAALIAPPAHAYTPNADSLLLVLAGIQDPGNLGTLVRSAEAFGAAAIVTTPGTVDPWNDKAIRASAGSVLRMPILSMDLQQLKRSGVPLIAAVARDGAAPEAADLRRGALMIGNEGAGLSETALALADIRITIPVPGAVESLNAAIAGSLLLYEAARQRRSL